MDGFTVRVPRGYGDGQMGRTHSWMYRRAFIDQEWDRLLAEAKRIVAQAERGLYSAALCPRRIAPIRLAGPRGTLWPLFEHQVIALNGKRPDHHDGFVLFKGPAGREVPDQEHGAFTGRCETAGRPYDAVIVAILAAAWAIAPGVLEVHCKDGATGTAVEAFGDGLRQGGGS